MKPSPLPAPLVPIKDDPPARDRLSDPRFRNLLLGGAAAFIALVLLAAAMAMAGPGLGLVGVGTAIVALLLAWLLWRIGLPAQPGGVFSTGALVLCGALVLPLLVGIGMETMQMDFVRPLPRRNAETASLSVTPPAPPVPSASKLPLLQDAFPVVRPDPESESYVEVTKDSKIKIDNQFYRINAGEQFGFRRFDGNDVIFQVRDFLVSLPSTAVTVHRAKKPEPAPDAADAPPATEASGSSTAQDGEPRSPLEITRDAQAEAIRRYPALSVQDSRENRTYVEAYMKLKQSNADFFKDPEWPLQLAEGVAEREGWKREDR